MSAPDWNCGIHSDLVRVGNNSLYLRVSGPDRDATRPAVVCIAGMADTSATWAALHRHVSPFARIYSYDRAGLGASSLPADFVVDQRSYRNMAVELRDLLHAAHVQPPYVLVMHSMGGLPGREFLDMYPDDVAGMVFVDTITEHNHQSRPPGLPLIMHAMFEGLDRSVLHRIHPLDMTDEEFQQAQDWKSPARQGAAEDGEQKQLNRKKAMQAEVGNLIYSSTALDAKKQFERKPMGSKPVSVIKGDAPGEWRQMYDLAVSAGRGTEERRQVVTSCLAKADDIQLELQTQQLKLNDNSRQVMAKQSWHEVQWYEPELIAKEVKWCLQEHARMNDRRH